jgi:ABC-type multidrug transport system permease subunit
VLGANILRDTVTNEASYGWQCANLATILPVVAAAVIFFWICCLWLCGVGYSLQEEFDLVWGVSVKVLKRFLKCVFVSTNKEGV